MIRRLRLIRVSEAPGFSRAARWRTLDARKRLKTVFSALGPWTPRCLSALPKVRVEGGDLRGRAGTTRCAASRDRRHDPQAFLRQIPALLTQDEFKDRQAPKSRHLYNA